MIAFLDGTPLCTGRGGIARYTRELHHALQREFPESRFTLVSDQDGRKLGVVARRWWLAGLPRLLRQARASVFHGTDFTVPYLRACPAVMTLHDLSPWREDFAHETSPRIRRRTPVLLRLGLAAMIITPSDAIRREAIARFALPPERVVAVPLAAGDQFRPAAPPAGTPYFLAVGDGPRKNLEVTREAARKLGVELRVTSGETPEESMAALYSGALALVFPSLYEGFGLPVLEAMQCGTPVIASRDPALMGLTGGAAIHVDACDPRAWGEAMAEFLTSEDRRRAVAEAGLRRASEFSWARTARATYEVYEEAIARYGR